jgi:uracil-DNA glycosylase
VAATRKREFRDQEYWGRPVPGFGDPDARLVIVGLAPAAHGANRTGRMFTGDSSGNWLFDALYRHGFASQPESVSRDDGMRLIDCYVAAGARCAPPDNKPTREELEACGSFLVEELALLTRKQVIVVLGRIGWERYLRTARWWDLLGPSRRPPFAHGAEARLPDGTTLISSFHPSRQNTNTGKLTREMWDGIFRRARAILGATAPA